jgi:hypothetical protein
MSAPATTILQMKKSSSELSRSGRVAIIADIYGVLRVGSEFFGRTA